MPIHTNSIAALNAGGFPIVDLTYYFVDLNGSVNLSTTQIEVIQRKSVPNSLFRRQAIHGRPFVLVSLNYVLDLNAANNAMAAYDDLKRMNYGVQLTVHSLTRTSAAQVLDVVEAQPPRAVTRVVGSLVANATILQVVRWELMYP